MEQLKTQSPVDPNIYRRGYTIADPEPPEPRMERPLLMQQEGKDPKDLNLCGVEIESEETDSAHRLPIAHI